nr:MAG TPA: hypothetical protein [Bacteriophage sp.]
MLYWTCHRTISIRDFTLTQEPNFFQRKGFDPLDCCRLFYNFRC